MKCFLKTLFDIKLMNLYFLFDLVNFMITFLVRTKFM